MPYTISELSDRLEINELYSRYVHAADERDFDTLDKIFLPRSTFNYGLGDGTLLLYADVKATPMFSGQLFPWTFHACTNICIDFEKGGLAAKIKSKTICPMGRQNGDGKQVMFQLQGVYRDRVEKTSYGWRIVQRVWEESWICGPFDKMDGIQAVLEISGGL